MCVNIDPFWLTEVRERGFNKDTTLEGFLKLIDEVSMFKFPIHMRRMSLLEADQVGEPLDYVRDLIELTHSAEWNESAICHLFMRGVKCEESRKVCFKILRKNPDGDPKQLIAELQTLQTYPDKEGKAKAILHREICPNCHIKGHSEKDCWGPMRSL